MKSHEPTSGCAPFGSARTLAPFATTTLEPVPTAAARPAGARPKLDGFTRRFFADPYRGAHGVVEIAQLWRGDLLRIDQVDHKSGASMGPHQATYLVEDAAFPVTLPLVKKDGDAWLCRLPHDAHARIIARTRGGGPRPFTMQQALTHALAIDSEHGVVVPLRAGVGVSFAVGELTFLIRFASPSTAQWPLLAGVSLVGVAIAVLLSLSFHGALGALVALSTERADMASIDQLSMASRFGEALLVPMDEEEEPEPEQAIEQEEAGSEGSRAAGDEGKSGTTATSSEKGRFAAKGEGGEMVPINRQVASSSGLLAQSDSMVALLAMNMPPSGGDAMDAWGDFESSEAVSDVRGVYGLGMTGAGRAAGGDSVGGIWGTGELGTVGKRNPGAPGGLGDGRANLQCDTCGTVRPTMRPQTPVVNGGLDKRIIRKVVNQHKRELKACYQRELQSKKGLHGKIDVKWIIDSAGGVSKALMMASTMKNQVVEACVVNAVSRWRFPTPKDGGMVAVSYPFVFEATR